MVNNNEDLCWGCNHPRQLHGVDQLCGLTTLVDDESIDPYSAVECLCFGWWEPNTPEPYVFGPWAYGGYLSDDPVENQRLTIEYMDRIKSGSTGHEALLAREN